MPAKQPGNQSKKGLLAGIREYLTTLLRPAGWSVRTGRLLFRLSYLSISYDCPVCGRHNADQGNNLQYVKCRQCSTWLTVPRWFALAVADSADVASYLEECESRAAYQAKGATSGAPGASPKEAA